eukprot:CAMPEP_0204273100 /NCGR_PEP_ID=MMETSP0468-20130131/22555_1 /ASSEMBLY_ACC=CAM_ASM_000383 /TAXON_ID=2969 /ORGANISM="Oxyrrhis marina" /LENGTH=138 /DNA_ID=CAMNT_0051249039 /DNA_START=87 /DNA_END=503 /DNA_ORIENTATION=-
MGFRTFCMAVCLGAAAHLRAENSPDVVVGVFKNMRDNYIEKCAQKQQEKTEFQKQMDDLIASRKDNEQKSTDMDEKHRRVRTMDKEINTMAKTITQLEDAMKSLNHGKEPEAIEHTCTEIQALLVSVKAELKEAAVQA